MATYSFYTVKSGDNLTKLGRITKTSVNEIMKANPQIKDRNKIKIGQRIRLISGEESIRRLNVRNAAEKLVKKPQLVDNAQGKKLKEQYKKLKRSIPVEKAQLKVMPKIAQGDGIPATRLQKIAALKLREKLIKRASPKYVISNQRIADRAKIDRTKLTVKEINGKIKQIKKIAAGVLRIKNRMQLLKPWERQALKNVGWTDTEIKKWEAKAIKN